MKFDLNNLLAVLPEPVRREKKKAAVLGLLLTALGIVGVSQLWPKKLASAHASTTAKSSGTTDSNKKSKSTEGENPRLQLLNEWLESPLKPPMRNVFSVDYARYPSVARDGAEDARPSGIETIWDRIAKSESKRADEVEQRRNRQGQLLQVAQRFKLQTTLIKPGDTSQAMVNGRLVTVGEKLDADGTMFTVVSIDGRQVIVEREGVKIALSLGKEAAVVQ